MRLSRYQSSIAVFLIRGIFGTLVFSLMVNPVFSQSLKVDEPHSKMDFRYAPPEWQTAICLPDDPHKSLVDRSGELL